MSNQPTPPARGTGPTGDRAKGKTPPPPANRRISRPVETKVERNNDRFGLYFVIGATVVILLFGAGVFFLRSNRSTTVILPTATPAATATADAVIGTVPAVGGFESPIPHFTPPPSPTSLAPDAINSGPYATGAKVTSVAQAATQAQIPAKLPPQIPQAQMEVSPTSLDFGNVSTGQLPSGNITIANPSSVDLVLQGLYSDCECISATADAKTLRSGERTRIMVAYNPALDKGSGQVQHILGIVSTSGQEPLTEFSIVATLP